MPNRLRSDHYPEPGNEESLGEHLGSVHYFPYHDGNTALCSLVLPIFITSLIYMLIEQEDTVF